MNKRVLILLLFIAGTQFAYAQPTADFTYSISGTTGQWCVPQSVLFFNNSSSDVIIYDWSVNGVSFSSLQNPVRSFPSGGTYDVCLQVANSSGQTDSHCETLTFFDPLEITLTTNPSTGCIPLEVSFTVNSDLPMDSIIFDFGNGIIETQSPNGTSATFQQTYNASGPFTISATAYDQNECFSSITLPNEVAPTPIPTPAFDSPDQEGCLLPHTVNFQNLTDNASQHNFLWDFGDGNTSTEVNPSHNYTDFGTYDVTLIATHNTAGCADTITIVDFVQVGDDIDFTATIIDNGDCSNTEVSFQNQISIPGATYSWDFGDGNTSTAESPTHIYTTQGCFFPSLTITRPDGCSSTRTATDCIESLGPINANFNVIGDTLSCQPEALDFTATVDQAVSYTWQFGNGDSSSSQNTNYVFSSFGTYNVSVDVEFPNGCIQNYPVQTVSIERLLPTISADSLRGCAPLDVQFTSSIGNPIDPIISYNWTYGVGTSTDQDPFVTYPDSGMFDVGLIVESMSGCRDTVFEEDLIRVGIPPVVEFSADPTVVCIEDIIQFTDESSDYVTDWLWEFGDGGTSTDPNPMYEYTDTGTFDVTLYTWYHGCMDSLMKVDYTIVSPPKAQFTVDQDCQFPYQVTFGNTSIGAETYLWDFGDGNTSTDSLPTHTYAANGSYDIVLTVTNATTGCEDDEIISVQIIDSQSDFSIDETLICAGDTVDITNSSILITNNNWDLPAGVVLIPGGNANANPRLYFPTPGVYTGFSLIGTNDNNCADTITVPTTVTVSGVQVNYTADVQLGCPPLEVSFTGSATSTTPHGLSYSWDFGDGNTSIEQSPTHTYQSEDAYTPVLTATNDLGCSASFGPTDLIRVAIPVASFNSTYTDCSTFEITFDNTSAGAFGLIQWDFGDGVTSTTRNPVHQYAVEGIYEVCLYLDNGPNCTDQVCDSVVVTRPTANFSGDNLYKSCPSPPLLTTFTDLSIGAIAWDWDFGDNTSSTLQNPVKSYGQAGTFTVCLTVTDSLGCQDTHCENDYITIDGPNGTFQYDQDAGCVGTTVTFIGTGTNVSSYFWDFGDGNGGLNNTVGAADTISHTYANSGVFTPVLIVEDASGCRVPLTVGDITIHELDIDFTADRLAFCEEDDEFLSLEAQYTHTDVLDNLSWTIEHPDTTLYNGGSPNPFFNLELMGTYDVTLIVNTQYCTDTLTRPAFVSVNPNPVAGYLAQQLSQCVPEDLVITNTSNIASGAIDTFNWTLDGILASQDQSPVFPFSEGGTYNLSLEVISDAGCRDTLSESFTFYDVPTIEVPTPPEICIGESLDLDISVLPVNGVTYQWAADPTLSCTDCPRPTATPPGNTTYYVTVTTGDGCTASSEVHVVAGPYSLPAISLQPDTAICDQTSTTLIIDGMAPGETYFWSTDRPGLSCYNCPAPVASPLDTTTYVVTVTNAGGCVTVDSIQVGVIFPDSDVATEDRIICLGDSIQIGATGVAASWSPNIGLSCTDCLEPIAFPSQATTYIATVTTADGCIVMDTVEIGILTPDDITAGPDVEVCFDANTSLLADFEGSGQWYNDQGTLVFNGETEPTVTGVSDTYYILEVTQDACVLYDTVEVAVVEEPQISVDSYEICEGELAQIEVISDADIFEWIDSDGLSHDDIPNPVAQPDETTTYTLLASKIGCEPIEVEVEVVVHPNPDISFDYRPGFLEGESLDITTLVDGSGDYTYAWDLNAPLSCFDCPNPSVSADSSMQIGLTVTDQFGCVDSAYITAELLEVCDDRQIVVPTAFTPNNDGNNDRFFIRGDAELILYRVFNRWGEVVFESQDKNEGWDGSYDGKLLNRDVFVYYIEARCKFDNSVIIKTGDITLLR